MVVHIAPYEVEKHAVPVFHLWQATLGMLWPLDETRLHQVLTSAGQHFVALESNGNEEIIGFVATTLQGKVGHISVLLVKPQNQRQGVGTMLYDAALAFFQQEGVTRALLAGGSARFFPGLPDNLPHAVAFFRVRRWNFDKEPYHVTYDLTQDIRNYATPQYVKQRMETQHVSFSTITPTQGEELLAFEAREFPEWLDPFERVIASGDYDDLLVGRDETGHIVASLIMYTQHSSIERHDVLWQGVFGKKLGAIGCVGVAEKQQGRGIGIALVARATELLVERGVEHCSIDWVVLTDFYAKLGYRIWRGYHMCSRDL